MGRGSIIEAGNRRLKRESEMHPYRSYMYKLAQLGAMGECCNIALGNIRAQRVHTC